MRLTSSFEEDTRSEIGLKCKLLMAKTAENYGPGHLGRVAAKGSLGMLYNDLGWKLEEEGCAGSQEED